MVPIETWNGPEVIMEGLRMHAESLISEGQEVEFWDKWSGSCIATIFSYDPHKEMFEFVLRDDHEVSIVDIAYLRVLKILPSRKMTPALAYAQMEQMSRYIDK